MSTAVVTIVAGRHQHLLNQQRGLVAGTCLPDVYVVVAMGDPIALAVTRQGPLVRSACSIHTALLEHGGDLPLAAARNVGAELAAAAGADVIIFLDVDCIPSAGLVGRYASSVTGTPEAALHCGVVRYLTEDVDTCHLELTALAGEPHPARPRPAAQESIWSDAWALFWSLSFAVSVQTWRRLGGFCEEYVGYGAEDTDFGYAAHRRGIELRWIGGADAFHQYHPTNVLPIAHLVDIVRNAGIFHRRWGFWPMQGWLAGFQETGLADYDADHDRWVVRALTGQPAPAP